MMMFTSVHLFVLLVEDEGSFPLMPKKVGLLKNCFLKRKTRILSQLLLLLLLFFLPFSFKRRQDDYDVWTRHLLPFQTSRTPSSLLVMSNLKDECSVADFLDKTVILQDIFYTHQDDDESFSQGFLLKLLYTRSRDRRLM